MGNNIYNNLPGTVYHGSLTIHRENLIKGIDVKKGQSKVDFGKGFYVTSNYEQARTWANKRANTWNEMMGENTLSYLTTYEVNTEMLAELRGLYFPHESFRWTKFVLRNRTLPTEHGFDYVIGPVADGKTKGLIDDCNEGRIDIEELKRRLTGKSRRTMQMSLNTQLSIECLTLIEEVSYNGDYEETQNVSG